MRKAGLFGLFAAAVLAAAPAVFAQENTGKALVVYFSATGTTERAAERIAELTGADVYEIVPAQPYTSADLSYRNDGCRANAEQQDPSARPAVAGSGIADIAAYDTVYVGFPVWWGRMPKIMFTFFDAYDFSGKTIRPFCTSGGSGIAASVNEIRGLEPQADVQNGLRVRSLDDLDGWL